MASPHNETAPSRFQRLFGASATSQGKYLVPMYDFRGVKTVSMAFVPTPNITNNKLFLPVIGIIRKKKGRQI
jgi:hypothetical protein